MELKISDNIKRLRKENKFTQEQLAEALGVTVGAVYKWENGLSMPEIRLLVEMAELFDTSVDVILGYGWQKGSMGTAAEKIHAYSREKNFAEGLRYAERALQKYPNSFEVVYQSATLYFLAMLPRNEKAALRAIQLYERAIELFDQNPYEEIGLLTLKNRVASCYCYLDKMDKAIELFKKNNVEGLNDTMIGLLLSQTEHRTDEALPYLSDAFGRCYSSFYQICIGFASVFEARGEYHKIRELMLCLYELGQALRDPSVVTYMDKGDIRIFTILAEVARREGDEQTARDYLLRAKALAERFDAAPEYRVCVGQKYYYGSPEARSYDDMGETAMDVILNFLRDVKAGAGLQPIWEEICYE